VAMKWTKIATSNMTRILTTARVNGEQVSDDCAGDMIYRRKMC
jgi:hypothetical protein